MKLDRVGVFEFSREKNTKADKLKPQIPAKVKKQRKKQLMELQQSISKEINKKLIGKKVDCIIEALNSDGTVVGRTYKDAPEVDGLVFINTEEIIEPGDIITAKITGAVEYDLIAEY
ncbi:MAG: TRAM domain-containing protein [Candidatus Gastranaerophilales bacterium]|nr:TRAM domain-containing protein [Candidatus Gastranaerophilales bacterium]